MKLPCNRSLPKNKGPKLIQKMCLTDNETYQAMPIKNTTCKISNHILC